MNDADPDNRTPSSDTSDLLIAGSTEYTAQLDKLFEMYDHWNAPLGYPERVDALRDPDGLDLPNHVQSDGALDRLTGSRGADYFLSTAGEDISDQRFSELSDDESAPI